MSVVKPAFLEHRTSNAQHRTSKGGELKLAEFTGQQVAEGGFHFGHLGGVEFAHAAGEFAMIETCEFLHVHCRVFGQPARFAEIDFASHATDLGGQRGHDHEGTGVFGGWERKDQNGTALLDHADFSEPYLAGVWVRVGTESLLPFGGLLFGAKNLHGGRVVTSNGNPSRSSIWASSMLKASPGFMPRRARIFSALHKRDAGTRARNSLVVSVAMLKSARNGSDCQWGGWVMGAR